jgi:hypothetical protein
MVSGRLNVNLANIMSIHPIIKPNMQRFLSTSLIPCFVPLGVDPGGDRQMQSVRLFDTTLLGSSSPLPLPIWFGLVNVLSAPTLIPSPQASVGAAAPDVLHGVRSRHAGLARPLLCRGQDDPVPRILLNTLHCPQFFFGCAREYEKWCVIYSVCEHQRSMVKRT